MAGYLLHERASIICSHGGQAQPMTPNPRVRVAGQAIVTQATTYTVTGCPFAPGGVTTPCVTGRWVTAAVRVRAGGQPVLLENGESITEPNAVPLDVLVNQVRVKGK
jgi:hypothetical protein